MVQVEYEDRISALSNTLLSIILSFLDTKQVVRTSLLSKRWRFVWTNVPALDFASLDTPNKASFISFVYKALVLNHAPQIKLFRLSNIDFVEECHVHSWVWTLLRRGVVEISLCSINREAKLAEGLFLSENLRALNLVGNFILRVNVSYFDLPNLEILKLSGVVIKDGVLDVSSTFPRLRELVLHNWTKLKVLHIHSSSLRTLKIRFFMLSNRNLDVQHVIIEAPSLEYLFVSDNTSFYDIKGMCSLIEAKVNVCKQSCGLRDFFQQISSLRTLRLSIATVYQLLENVYPHEIPVFDNLTCLELADGTWSLVLHMLDHAPNLVSLIVHKHNYSEDWMDYWNPLPYCTPKCLSRTLKSIEFYDFCGFEKQVRIAEYLLRTAAKLRMMKIHMTSRDADEEMLALLRLLKVPRVSSNCEFSICTPGKNRL